MTESSACWLIIPAAGSGSRMGLAHAKQYLSLHGQPMLAHTVNAFLACDFIAGIVVAVAEHDTYHRTVSALQHPKVSCCIGGTSRAESVLAGLQALTHARDNDWVMVHDAARPCVSPQQLQALYNTLALTPNGGFWAIPVADTLKNVSPEQAVSTVDRRYMVRAQTPQMFRLGALREALSSALAKGYEITDEASAMEHSGIEVRVIDGHSSNIKVTYPDDAALAAFYLQQIQEQQQ